MSDQPSPNGENCSGRDAGGRFASGNRGGPGNPHAKAVGRLRSALLMAVKPEDINGIVTAMIDAAKGGDVAAAREVLNRTIGTALPADVLDRIDARPLLIRGRPDNWFR